MSRVIVVAGVDTGVGKTCFALALAQAATNQGLRVCALKPIESGCDDSAAEDGRRLAASTGQLEPRAALQRFRAAISPWLAAERESSQPRPDLWLNSIVAARHSHDLTIVEGAGGLLSPLAPGFDLRLLIHALDAEVCLVAADRLGAQASIIANLEALEALGRPLPTLVLSTIEATAELGNEEILRRVRSDLEILRMPKLDAASSETFSIELESWL